MTRRRDYQPGQGPVRGIVAAAIPMALFWGAVAALVIWLVAS